MFEKFKRPMFAAYVAKLIFRICVFFVVLAAYFLHPEYFDLLLSNKEIQEFQLSGWTLAQINDYLANINHIGLYVVWGIMMGGMILHMLPTNKWLTMGSKKVFDQYYQPVEEYNELKMHKYMQQNNLSAMWVLIAWLCVNAVFGALYVFNIIEIKELVLLTTFYYVCDLRCVVIWCPFQSFFMKNKCCVNCRIFNWGHFMMYTPMLFIRNFFTWSLFFTSLMVMLRWEITLLKHPEQFWEGSNKILKCANCKDKICKIKGPKFVDRIDV